MILLPLIFGGVAAALLRPLALTTLEDFQIDGEAPAICSTFARFRGHATFPDLSTAPMLAAADTRLERWWEHTEFADAGAAPKAVDLLDHFYFRAKVDYFLGDGTSAPCPSCRTRPLVTVERGVLAVPGPGDQELVTVIQKLYTNQRAS